MARPLSVLGLLLAALWLAGCDNACEKYQAHVLQCHADFCAEHAANPICSAEERAAAEREMDCDDTHEHVAEQLIERDCAQLARQLGWEALNHIRR